MTLAWIEASIAQRVAQKKRYSTDAKPPQDQCHHKEHHEQHTYEDDEGLIWSSTAS